MLRLVLPALLLAGVAQGATLEIRYDPSAPVAVPGVRPVVCFATDCPGGTAEAPLVTDRDLLAGARIVSVYSEGGPDLDESFVWTAPVDFAETYVPWFFELVDDGAGGLAIASVIWGGLGVPILPGGIGASDANRPFIAGAGDTYLEAWIIGNGYAGEPVLEYVFDFAASGGGVFDTGPDLPGTPGSGLGWPVELLGGGLDDDDVVIATYANPISVGGRPAAGDLWGTLTLDFRGVTTLGLPDGLHQQGVALRFDTDAIVPLPITALLLLTGLSLLALSAKRKGPLTGPS